MDHSEDKAAGRQEERGGSLSTRAGALGPLEVGTLTPGHTRCPSHWSDCRVQAS